MANQRDILLSVFYLRDKIWGRTYLQKFIYLLNREVFENKLFEYTHYRFGPFCEEINEELAELEEEGAIEEKAELTQGLNTAYTYSITVYGKKVAADAFNKRLSLDLRNKLVDYTNQFRSFTPTELLKYVYEKYPEVTENSEFGHE